MKQSVDVEFKDETEKINNPRAIPLRRSLTMKTSCKSYAKPCTALICRTITNTINPDD